MTKRNVNYLRGLLESDGSMQIHISGKNFKPLIKFSQIKDDFLDSVQGFLNSKGRTTSKEEKSTKTPEGRAGNVRIQGKKNVKKLWNFLQEENQDSFIFSSSKQRDFFILQKITSMSFATEREKAQGLPRDFQSRGLRGLKKSLHKSKRTDPDSNVSGAKTLQDWEKTFGFTPGTVEKKSEPELVEIDEAYAKHVRNLTESISNGSLKVDGNSITGLIDGDGHYGVGFVFRETNRKREKKASGRIEWETRLKYSTELNAKLTIDVLMYYMGVEGSIRENSSRKKPNVVTSYEVLIRKQEYIRKFRKLHETFPLDPPCFEETRGVPRDRRSRGLRGFDKKKRFETVEQLFYLRDKNFLTDFESVKKFLEQIYAASSLGGGASERSLPLQEAIQTAKDYFS